MSNYEPSEFGPSIENGINLSDREQERLADTRQDFTKNAPRLARKFNNKLNPRARRNRRIVAASVGTALLGIGIIVGQELSTTPSNDLIAEAKSKVLADADLLKQLGICSVELQAQAALERYKAGHDIPSDDGFVAQNYDDAALLAEKANVPCDPSAGDQAEYVTRIHNRDVVLRPWQITDYNVQESCDALVRDAFQPQEMINPDLAIPDIANQQALLLSSSIPCPEAGTYGIPGK